MTFQEYEARREEERKIILSHMEKGVDFANIDTVYIDDGVEIGAGTFIGPNVTLNGPCKIGENCTILQNTRISNSTVGNETTIEHAVILDSSIGSGVSVGPFAYIRPGTVVEDNCKIGDFVEIKNSTIGEGTKASHLTYIGDADLGKDINLGCGTVFVNYDGTNKFRTKVGDGSFIGCNTNLIAPIELEEGSYVAAGSTLTKDVPKDALAIARADQKNIEGWAKKAGLYNKK